MIIYTIFSFLKMPLKVKVVTCPITVGSCPPAVCVHAYMHTHARIHAHACTHACTVYLERMPSTAEEAT